MKKNNDLKNLNLQVAQFALNSVKNVLEHDQKEKEKAEDEQELVANKYKTISKKMTVLIQKNGLIGTLVFILSKKDKSHEFILDHAITWCKEDSKLEFLKNKLNFNSSEEFIESITKLLNKEYRLVTKEIMNLFGWIKRFVDGMIEGEEND